MFVSITPAYSMESNQEAMGMDIELILEAMGMEVEPTQEAVKTANYALLEAAKTNNLADVERLIAERIANINAEDSNHETALIHAVQHRNIDMVNALVNAEANVNVCDKNGVTLLELATYFDYSHSVELVKILIDSGSTQKDKALLLAVDHYYHTGYRPHMYKIFKRELKIACLEIVKLLIKAGAYVNTKNSTHSTLLMLAVKKDNTDIAQLLIEAGADVNVINHFGETALINALKRENFELLYPLVKANANIPDKYYLELLDIASRTGYEYAACKSDMSFLIINPKQTSFAKKNIETLFMIYRQGCSDLSVLPKEVLTTILTYAYPEYAINAKLHPQILVDTVPCEMLAILIKNGVLDGGTIFEVWGDKIFLIAESLRAKTKLGDKAIGEFRFNALKTYMDQLLPQFCIIEI